MTTATSEHPLHDDHRTPAHPRSAGRPAGREHLRGRLGEPGPEPRAERPRRSPAAAGGRPRRGAGAPRRGRHGDCAEPHQARWAYAEWLDLARRRFRDGGALVYSPGTGRAAVLAPRDDGSTHWRCWPSWGCAGAQARPSRGAACGGSGPWLEAPRDGRPRAPPRSTSPPSSAATSSPRWWKERASSFVAGGVSARASAPSTRSARAASRCTATRSAGTASAAARAATCWTSSSALEGLSLPEAIRRLDAAPPTAVVSLSHRRPAPAPVPSRDPALLTAAGRFYGGELRRSREARAYLASRGIRLETAARLGLGYAPGAGCGASLRAPASARSGSGTRGCSRSGASASPAWWSCPRSRAVAFAGLREGPSTRSGRHGSSRCQVPSPCSGGGGLAPPRRGRSWPRASSTGSSWRSGACPPAPPWGRRVLSGWPPLCGAARGSSSPSTTTRRVAKRRRGLGTCLAPAPPP